MNTLQQSRQNTKINDNDQQYFDELRALSQIRQRQGRDYGRILRACNTPAQWYRAYPTPHSIYFYDPQYQRYLQQQSRLVTNNRFILPSTRAINRTPSCPKCDINLRNTSSNYQQKQRRSSQSHIESTLPPINDYKTARDT